MGGGEIVGARRGVEIVRGGARRGARMLGRGGARRGAGAPGEPGGAGGSAPRAFRFAGMRGEVQGWAEER